MPTPTPTPTPHPSEDLPSNVTAPRIPNKRKREPARPFHPHPNPPNSNSNSNSKSKSSTPNAFARRSPPPPRPTRREGAPDSPPPPRKLKRPGAGARIAQSNRDAVEAARRRREEDERRAAADRQASDLVAEHYNAVPERGRDWRQTESKIKGLRSLNNWVKSTLIQKFSRPDGLLPGQPFCVLDMACGKGGDLGKWEKAPVVPSLYVGCDIADVSIQQAKSRYEETLRRHRRGPPAMHAEFYVQDTFGRPLGEIERVRQVGFHPNAGPGPGVIQAGMGGGGWDVVSMMFALHYSFESEQLARGMLKNVAGVLKKGGRFIGVMPNSDVISANVKRLLLLEGKGKTPNGKLTPAPAPAAEQKDGSEDGEVEEDDWDPEKPSEPANGTTTNDDDDDWDPEKPSEPAPATADDDDDWDPEKPAEPSPLQPNGTTPAAQTPASDTSHLPPLEWGNSIYTVRFPRTHPLPKDGIFRPPYGWKYHYQLEEAVDVPEYVVPWEGFRALAEDYGLELMYKKGFKEILDEIWDSDGADGGMQRDLAMLAERMGVLSRDRSAGRGGLMVGEEEMEAAAFYLGFCFYKI